MGKGAAKKGGQRGGSKYVHNHTYNPNARESDERKLERIHSIEVKRHQKYVDRYIEVLSNYLPPDARKKETIDPNYNLKGAARPARDFYKPPGAKDPIQPVDIIEKFGSKGLLWDSGAEEARPLLRAMSDPSVVLHQMKGKTRESIKVLKRMLELDKADHLFARQRLLRCYLDLGEAALARDLLDRYPDDPYCCFAYSRVLIECIALMLEEDDASEENVEAALEKAYALNPFGIWVIALHETFADAVEHADRITDETARPRSMVDAIRFYDVDFPIWKETEGAIEHVLNYIEKHDLQLPSEDEMISSSSSNYSANNDSSSSGPAASAGHSGNDDGGDNKKKDSYSEPVDNETAESIESDIEMFESMYRTAIEMASS